MSERRLICWSDSGLGDRLFAICRTLEIADMLGVKPVFLWEYNHNLNCDFDVLFDNRNIEVIYKLPKNVNVVENKHEPITLNLWNNHDDVVIKTYNHMEDPVGCTDSDLSPILINHKLMAYAEMEAYHLGVFNCIGVHIRRGDLLTNKFYTKKFLRPRLILEPTYYNWIDDFYPHDPLFISTESRQVEKNFRARYGERVVMRQKKSYVRKNPQGIKDAMVDMLLLAQTKQIIGARSMFSIVAAKLGGITCEQIVPEDEV